MSESTSENEQPFKPSNVTVSQNISEPKYKQRRQYHSTEQLQQRPIVKKTSYAHQHDGRASNQLQSREKNHFNHSREKLSRYPLRENYEPKRSESRKPPPIPGPQKPARSADRRRAFSS